MATQLIPLHTRSINEQTLDTVNARELHAFLEVGRYFANWIKARIDKYGFEEGVDYTVVSRLPNSASGNRGATKEYFITLDMAKELAMVELNDKGKQARRYFIDCEKQLNEQKHLPATTNHETNFQNKEKYQILNNMITAMKLEGNPVVVPSKELVDLIQAVRMYQTQIAQLRTPDWVNKNVECIKEYANRTFLDV
ncbi:antA/AntB antirepressor family protein [Marinomonas sp. FW-1]|uniref:antA/AntB antirepressor family protein n=1 Tax=Marinomonas sp. FW-1 TaxID=2071621 RepID=UPI0010BF6A11|nr:antA/AntB antirepressor family protein [Marinomonas sp. FW-1]